MADVESSTTRTALVVVDHGSRRAESNDQLLRLVAQLREQGDWQIVEPAHMELAPPTISDAFARCVAQGAQRVTVFPYFLAPGRHWQDDIPRLAAEAARRHPGLQHFVTAPLGLHPLLADIIRDRVAACESRITAAGPACDFCDVRPGCARQ